MLPAYDDAKSLFSAAGLEVSRETYQNMEHYAVFLADYNQKVNLTAITDGDGILKKHFIDSMLLGRFCENELTPSARVLDIGSGAGFPGVPLALLRGDLDITLMDSLNKRITFLELLRGELGLHYRAIHGRAEELARKPDFREHFDIVTARAVAALPTLAEYSLPFVKVGGHWLAMKGPGEDLKPALQAIRVLGGEYVRTEQYTLPDGEERVIYVVKKITPTATKFPRNSGQIKSKPL